jgi:hypothetical protein
MLPPDIPIIYLLTSRKQYKKTEKSGQKHLERGQKHLEKGQTPFRERAKNRSKTVFQYPAHCVKVW